MLNVRNMLMAMMMVSQAGNAAAASRLGMLCSATQEWCDLLSRKYEERFHVPVQVKQMGTNAALDEIRKTGGSGTFDVWFGGTGDPHLEAASEDLTLSYQPSRLKDLHDWAQRQASMSNFRTVGIYSGMLGFIVNEEKLKQKNIKVPRCWFNLLRPEYKGLVAAPNPATSGTGYTMIATLVSMMGEEQAFSYMVRIRPAVREYVKSGSQLAPKVAKGEAPIAIGFIHDGARERQIGAPVTVVSPCEGTGYETGSVSIVRGGNAKEARRFVDWVLTPEVQSYAAQASQLQVPSNRNTPIPPGTPRFSDFKIYMAYDPKKFAAPEEKRRLTARWEKEVGSTVYAVH
jgi:iron(III) transport system substrate-binding protein